MCNIFWEKLSNEAKLCKPENYGICFVWFLSSDAKNLFLQGRLETKV